MTGSGVLLLAGITLVAFAAGAIMSTYMKVKARRIGLGVAAIGPLAAYWLWGTAEGCVMSPSASPEQCFGWGFGLAILAGFAMPAWFVGLALGYFNPWVRKYRAAK